MTTNNTALRTPQNPPRPPAENTMLARRFAEWYFQGQDAQEDLIEDLPFARQIHQSFALLGDDLPYLWKRFSDMEEYEKQTLNELRNRGASIPDIIDYIRAENGLNPENKAIRKDVAGAIKRKAFKAKSKRWEGTVRAGALVAATTLLIGVGAVAVVTGAGAATAPLWAIKAISISQQILQAAAGGGVIMLLCKGRDNLHELKHSSPKLDLGKDSDFSDLKTLGSPNYEVLNEQWESIPSADQHIIKHFSPTELRMFLLGTDAVRLHIMNASPPTPWAQIQSVLEPVLQPDQSRWENIKAMCRSVFEMFKSDFEAPIQHTARRLAEWRAFAFVNEEHNRAKNTSDKSPG